MTGLTEGNPPRDLDTEATGNAKSRARRVENLITLCQRHHMLWEEFAPLQPDIR